MTQPSEDTTPFALSPDEAFSLLGNETRIEILRTLWEAHDPYEVEAPVQFSKLFEEVDIEDSGNFNYHLGQLTDHFVAESDEGYRLAGPGFRVIRAVIAGTATANPTLEPTRVDVTCPQCGSDVEVSHRDGSTWARCTQCEGFWPYRGGEIIGFELPPQGLHERSAREILTATIVYSLHRANSLGDGVCPDCAGSVTSTLHICEDHQVEDGICQHCGRHFLGLIRYVCTSCKYAFRTPSWHPLQSHPAVVSFYDDHDIEHIHTQSWEGMSRGFEWDERLLSTDPASLEVTVRLGDDVLRVTIDERGKVDEVSSAPA